MKPSMHSYLIFTWGDVQTIELRREISELKTTLHQAECDESALKCSHDKQATSLTLPELASSLPDSLSLSFQSSLLVALSCAQQFRL